MANRWLRVRDWVASIVFSGLVGIGALDIVNISVVGPGGRVSWTWFEIAFGCVVVVVMAFILAWCVVDRLRLKWTDGSVLLLAGIVVLITALASELLLQDPLFSRH